MEQQCHQVVKMESIFVTAFKHKGMINVFFMPHVLLSICVLLSYYPSTMLFISQTFIYAHLLCYAPFSSVNTQYYKEVGIYENNLL